MTLKETRVEFVNQSGRLDLMNADQSDNGANFYINAGQKFLDQLSEKHEEVARVFRIVDVGKYFVYFQDCRAIHRVGIGDSDSIRWLTRKTYPELRELYSKPFDFIDYSKPLYYTPAYLRHENDMTNNDGIIGYMDAMTAWRDYNGVIFLPPTDQQYHVEVWGKFWSKTLSNDSDESYWTNNHNHILVMAAQRALEVFYRNTQGVQDWTAAIQSEILGHEKDFVEQSYGHIDQIEG